MIRLYDTDTKHIVSLVKKSESWVMRLAGWALSRFTPTFMERFWTTMGNTIYTPTRYDNDLLWGSPSWLEAHRVTLEHELVHVRQRERWGTFAHVTLYIGPALYVLGASCWCFLAFMLGWVPWWVSPTLGVAGLALLPLSMGLAWGRWRVEREAYLVNIRAREGQARIETIAWIVNSLWSNYMWTWPRSWMRKWFEEHA